MTNQNASQSRFFHIPPEGRFYQIESQSEAVSRLGDSGYVWFDFLDPSREELQALIAPLGLHPLSIEDCLDQEQVPKIEDFPSHNFILFNRYRYAEHTVIIDEVDFFLGRNYLISVGRTGDANGNSFVRLEDAIERDLMNVRKGPDYLLHVFMDYVVDEKFRAIEALQEELDAAEETVIESPAVFNPKRPYGTCQIGFYALDTSRILKCAGASIFCARTPATRTCSGAWACPYKEADSGTSGASPS